MRGRPGVHRVTMTTEPCSMTLTLARVPAVQRAGEAPVPLSLRDGALLAWLALEGPTPRMRLAQLLWPSSDSEAARNALRQRLFHLRRLFGEQLVAGHATLSLAEGVTHDLGDSDQVLGEGSHDFGPELASWLTQQRERRRGRLRQSLVELCDMAAQARDYADALSHASELLALEPLSEEAHRRVMRLHYLAGDRAAALQSFDHCEQVLKDEVGTSPSPETVALLTTIERSDAEGAGMSQRVPASVLRPPRLVGREIQWAALHDAWDQGCAVVVNGEAGMGKTRLTTDFAIARGRTVVVGARPGDARVVYASMSRLLRQLPRIAIERLAPALRKELARLLPELGEAQAIASPEERTRFFNAIAAALDSPALELDGVVFDDLHFADDASVELLQYVAAGSRLRWLLAARGAEVSSAGRALLAELGAQADAVTIVLPPLTQGQVHELVASLDLPGLDAADAAAALLRHTGGNPLYLLETVKVWLTQAQGTAGQDPALSRGTRVSNLPARLPSAANVAALIERRIGQLSVQAVQLARCAAVAAGDFSIELASHVLGLRTLALADPCAELEAAQVFRDGAFVHDLIYESALASVPAPVAEQLHAEIASFLQARGGEPARLAQHWVAAKQWVLAGRALVLAADRSRDAARLVEQAALLAEAARCFELGGQPRERFDALLQRARMLSANDLGVQAQEAVAQLDEVAATDEQRLQALDARLELSMTRYEIDEALQLGRRAIESAQALGRQDLELRFAVILSGALCDARRAAEAVALLELYAPYVPGQSSVDQQWEYWEATALALDYDNRLRDAMPAWAQARELAHRVGRRDMVWKTMSNSASTQAKMGLVHQAVQLGAAARQLALEGSEGATMRVLQMQVTVAHRLRDVGRYAEALDMLEEALAGYERLGGSDSDKALVEQRLVVLFQQLGQPGRAVPLLAAERVGVPRGVAMIRLAHRAELEQQLGRDGLPLMRDALQIIPNPDDIYHRICSLFATRLVPPEEGEGMAASLAVWAGTRERYGVALAGHVRAAACALSLSAPARAVPHAEAALHLARSYQPDSFYLGEVWLVAAQAMRALGRDAEARRAADDGLAWVRSVHDAHVPAEFRDSFLHRNPVNRELLALAAQN
jgi:DNA-binding SARP family transcriptional activator/tetratricopeptide (TPR) repeat protein